MKYQFRIMKIKCYQVGRLEHPGVPVLAHVLHVWQPCSKQPTDMGGQGVTNYNIQTNPDLNWTLCFIIPQLLSEKEKIKCSFIRKYTVWLLFSLDNIQIHTDCSLSTHTQTHTHMLVN